MQDSTVRQYAKRAVYSDIKSVEEMVKECFPRLWNVVDACLSVPATLLLDDLTNPVGLNLVAPPSNSKTTVLSFFYDFPFCHKSDHFTPASFVSNSASLSSKQLSKVDLLPKMKNKVVLVPDLSPIFSERKEDLEKNIGVLVRVFDGQGYQCDSGVHGHRGYSGEYLFGWLGATTPLPHRVWQVMGKLGSRWLFLSMPEELSIEDERKLEIQNLINNTTYKDKIGKCKEVVQSFLGALFDRFEWNVEEREGGKRIKWDREKDKELLPPLIEVAQLVCKVRSTVSIWREKGGEGDEYSYSQPIKEGSARLSALLYNFARGHAIIHKRDQLSIDDVVLSSKIALSSMPDDRRGVIRFILKHKEISTGEINETLKVSDHTAKAIMKSLEVLGVIKLIRKGKGGSFYATLSDPHKSFIDKESDVNLLMQMVEELEEEERISLGDHSSEVIQNQGKEEQALVSAKET